MASWGAHRWVKRCLAGVLAAVVVPLSTVPAGADTVVAPTDAPCTELSAGSCLLPYPSDRWEVEDPASATGVRVVVPDDVLPARVLDQFGPGASVADAFDGVDGFSAVTPVFFEFPTAVEPTSLPGDGGDAVVAFDVTTGERVPVRAELSLDASRLGAWNRILAVWPVLRFEPGHRIGVFVTDSLRGAAGVPLVRAPGLDAASSRIERLRSEADRLLAVGSSGLLTATGFTVRSEQDVTGDVDRMAAAVRAEDHPIRNVRTGPSLIGGAAAVTGQVRVTDFRDADGVIPRGGTGAQSQRWIDFLMVMPERPASPAGAPVVIYGHGITVSKETMVAVAATNASKGIATVGIDVPNHGSRRDDGGFLLENTTPQRFGRLPSMVLQGELDDLSLLMAVQQHFGDLDPMPWQWWDGRTGDGVPDLDPSRVLYEGTSMGSFLGASFVALAPELDGAFLQVGGSGILDTLYHSVIWLAFTGIEPSGASPADVQALVGTVAMLLDRGDSANLLPRIRAAGTPVWLVYARDDGIVPNTSSDRLLGLLGLPLVGTEYAPTIPVARLSAMPPSGTGVSQISTSHLDGNLAKSVLAHVAFGDPAPMRDLSDWLDQRLAATA